MQQKQKRKLNKKQMIFRHYAQQDVVKLHLSVDHSVQVPNIVAENVKRNIGLNIRGRVRRR